MLAFLIMIILSVLPQCEHEDGSSQSVCVWQGSNGVVVLNWDYGEHYAVWKGENNG